MILYKFLFPKQQICDESELYYRARNAVVQDDLIILPIGAELISSTYFNSISLDKWYNNTISKNIGVRFFLKGSFSVRLGVMFLQNGKLKTDWE